MGNGQSRERERKSVKAQSCRQIGSPSVRAPTEKRVSKPDGSLVKRSRMSMEGGAQ